MRRYGSLININPSGATHAGWSMATMLMYVVHCMYGWEIGFLYNAYGGAFFIF